MKLGLILALAWNMTLGFDKVAFNAEYYSSTTEEMGNYTVLLKMLGLISVTGMFAKLLDRTCQNFSTFHHHKT